MTAQEIKQTSSLAAQKADERARGGRARRRAGPRGRGGHRADAWRASTTSASRWGRSPQKILELGERTQQIGGITQTVKDLADQSNMLALNAAIEAVRSRRARQGLRGGGARDPRAGGPVHPGHEPGARAAGRHRRSVSAAVRITERGRGAHGGGPGRRCARRARTCGSCPTSSRTTPSAVRQIAAAVNQQNVGINQITPP